MAFSSDEVNLLVYRYLLESDADVPPGALLTFLQKGLQYLEIETHLMEDGTERACDEPFRLTGPHICRVRPARKAEAEAGTTLSGGATALGASASVDVCVGTHTGDVTMLKGHRSEVFTVAFNPTKADLLASGSGDGAARIWQMDQRSAAGEVPSIVLEHAQGGAAGQDVSSLDWSADGTRLVTGCYDCRGRIWSAEGSLLHVLLGHTSQIMSVQWSPSGQHVLTGSVDKTAIVWDAAAGTAAHAFAFHSGPILDVDWASDSTFATCGSDKLVQVCTLGDRTPTRTLAGHADEVNAISWAPNRMLLASASDDCTARIWRGLGGSSDKETFCTAVLAGHKKQVYTVKWAPSGEGSSNPSQSALVATASFDGTVRLWDPSTGKSTQTLARHTAMVQAIAFSPDGNLIASGSADRCVHVWNVRTGALVRSFTGPSSIFDVSFNAHGDRIAAACANSAVAVIDIRL